MVTLYLLILQDISPENKDIKKLQCNYYTFKALHSYSITDFTDLSNSYSSMVKRI